MSGEKTEEPTERRKKQARKDGQTPKTQDFGSWGSMLLASMVIPMTATKLMDKVTGLMVDITATIKDPSPLRARALLNSSMIDAAIIVAPLCAIVALVAIAANAGQGGLYPAMKLVKPTASRLNPGSGIKRMFGTQSLWELIKALVKTSVVGLVLYLLVRNLIPTLLTAGLIPLKTQIAAVSGSAMTIVRTAAIAGVVLSVADYAVTRRRIRKQIKMSKEDIKQENRTTEGDPQVKQAIRTKQFEMSRKRMMAEVPKADVIVVNPTHVAVALRYEPAKGAPRVIAKGAGAVAAKIREKATEHRIPLVQDKPLARALYRDCELGDEIPAALYEAVAKILAFIMLLKAKGSAAGTHRSPNTG